MMQEAAEDDLENQWAKFDSFDFNSACPSSASSSTDFQRSSNVSVLAPDNAELLTNHATLTEQSELPMYECDPISESLRDNEKDLLEFEEPSRDLHTVRDEEYLVRLEEMEEEHDILNTSLMTLSTHFAQVQFRLKQISLTEDMQLKEKLIRELEVFASEGCPDVRGLITKQHAEGDSDTETARNDKESEETRDLIQRLQKQLTEVEQWAYECGQAEPPSMAVLERQKMILDTLQEKVKLGIEGYERLSVEELRGKVDQAVDSIILPYRKKEIAQERTLTNLQTFVDDLERYIDHLHRDPAKSQSGVSRWRTPATESMTAVALPAPKVTSMEGSKQPIVMGSGLAMTNNHGSVRDMVDRTYKVLQFFAFMNWSCVGQPRLQRNVMKTTTRGNHWGDARAALEMAISKVLDITQERAKLRVRKNGRAFDENERTAMEGRLTKAVRYDLAKALCLLMQHGLVSLSNDRRVAFNAICVSSRQEPADLHPWQFILSYYNYKKGSEFNKSATKKLTDSFQLAGVGEKPLSVQQRLLSTIGDIIHSHVKYKRTDITHLKALVCAGLNQKCLSSWLRIIYCTDAIVDDHYTLWSYASKTHFEDACQSLDNLSTFDFHLSADLAVEPFRNLDDAF